MKNIVYRFSNRFFLTRNLTKKIGMRVHILYPSNKSSIIRKIERYLISLYCLGFICIAFLMFFADISIYYSVLAGLVVFVIFEEKIEEDMSKLEYKVLKQLLKFVEDVKFRFQFDGMIEQAILYSINDADVEMSAHGQKIYECLQESYYFDKQEYIEISPNHFFLTFYSLCETVMLYGDKKSENGSVFLKNLGYLKEEINIELLKREKVNSNFLGLRSICIIPLFFIKVIEKWTISNIPELEASYTSDSGVFIDILLFLIAIISYKVVNLLKFGATKKITSEFIKNMSKVGFIDKIIRSYIGVFIKQSNKIKNLIKEVAYDYTLKEFMLKRFINSIIGFLLAFLVLGSSCFVNLISIGITNCIILSFIVMFFIFWYEVFALKIKKQIILLEREDEIVRFQNIILMMMHMDKVTIEQILTEMERFAKVFRSKIENIVDRYTYKGKEVFEEAKEESGFRPFERLMDGFIACDDTYIYNAFDDLEKDRRYFLDRHKQENDRIITDKTTIAKVLSFIPLCMIIALKLIMPFVLHGLTVLQGQNMF